MNQTLASKEASKESLGRLPSLNTSARSKPAQIKPPQQVRLRRAQKLVELVWPDGHTSQLSCLLLRKSCACSSCARAEQTGQLTLLDADVGVERVELSVACSSISVMATTAGCIPGPTCANWMAWAHERTRSTSRSPTVDGRTTAVSGCGPVRGAGTGG